ncbi:unnamed protein product [Protopolystoma xenopodis]|uniref:Transcription initiation factor TFIID subunit 12 domain-containing protein n=1 Tax=Protopolystoma xenopodis TaxID=117903 RepID=A0A3S5CEN2_9PLAT|nr:unnamed protein product [Protopolystoma xenopodis]
MSDAKPPLDAADSLPSSIGVVRAMFEELNILDVSDEVCCRVLDVIYRYTSDVIEEAKAVANHSGRLTIEESDMELAIEMKKNDLLLAPLHRDSLLDFSKQLNSITLPPVRLQPGIKLPPDRFNLAAPNYALPTSVTQTPLIQKIGGQSIL